MNMRRDVLYQAADTALVRAARYVRLPLPPLPDVSGDAPHDVRLWHQWLRTVAKCGEFTEIITHANPGFARHLATLCAAPDPQARQVRRTLVSVLRYVRRIEGRATPNGLVAGVAPVTFGSCTLVYWGPWHRARACADGAWIADLVQRLEEDPALLRRLPVMASNTPFIRGERLVVPYPSTVQARGRPTAEVSMRCTPAVRAALELASSPISYDLLAEKLRGGFPHVPPERVRALLRSLVRHGALITSLHAPATTPDPLDHVLQCLEAVAADDLPSCTQVLDDLRAIHNGVLQHNRALGPSDGHRLRVALHNKMVSGAAPRPLAVDLRLDCALVLPTAVAQEAENAATVLTRLTPAPFGTPGWKAYHGRFFEKYGIGSLVPLRDVTDPDVGLGFPAGYLDSPPEPYEGLAKREQGLLALAQNAALDDQHEILLNDDLVEELRLGDQDGMQPPPHMELCFSIEAESHEALSRGDFTLTGAHPTRGIGTTSGRFLPVLDDVGCARASAPLEHLPANTAGALTAQLSFAPLNRTHTTVTRVPEVLPTVISVAEHRTADERVIDLDDLAVSCDRSRLYLVSLSRKRVIEPHTLHALDLRTHTPPLVRFLTEISRAQCAIVTEFPWGAATEMPYLPRVRYGRTILAQARWLLHTRDLPDSSASWKDWHAAIEKWRIRRRVPDAVALTEGDQRLPLNLAESAHRAILRAHLTKSPTAILSEAAEGGAWFDGRAHEVTVPLTLTRPSQWPAGPPVTKDRVLSRDHGHLPGSRPWLLAQLYGHPERHAEILARHLPALLNTWDTPPAWWYLRYQDPHPHLRLRIAVPADGDAGQTAARISDWTAELRRAGLVNDLKFATTYPETGRWGRGTLMAAAENVFAADSRVLAAQFTHPHGLPSQALAAANFTSIASAFTGTPADGMHWLIERARITAPRPLDRRVLTDALRLADPEQGREAMKAVPGGPHILHAWDDRARALTHYRSLLTDDKGLQAAEVLDSLMHAHHIRAVGIDKDDERTCMRLARAAALAWKAKKR
ncbi:lantibiotic dehydratase [Streptomyces sp. NPDC058657]|uniref:lantibiotic dehydratase n=1 Tax=unclassified Streptomyces TaxID=2593676 RepID=UPI0036550D22